MNNQRPEITFDSRYFQKLPPGSIGYDPVAGVYVLVAMSDRNIPTEHHEQEEV